MQPLVSIVTPSLNQAQYLEATILSVLNQTYPNIEYIVIDGGSTDGSVDIIKKYAHQLAYWVSEKDQGQADAINKGFEKCKGQLFAYLNSDDLLEPDAVQQVVSAYLSHPDAAVLYGKCITIDAYGNILKPAEGKNVDFEFLLKTGMLPRIYQPACFFNTTFLSRRPLFKRNLQFVMDYELLLSLLKEHSFHFINLPLAQYRVHPQAKTSAFENKMLEEKMMIQKSYGLPVRWRRMKHILRKYLTVFK